MKTASNSRVLRTIPLLIAFYLVSMPAQAQYSGGTGEPNDPYLIYTAEQMNEIGTEPNDWDKHFKLMADIDLNAYTNEQFNIIGGNPPFTGVFDGNRHVISNFSYTSTDKDCIGLFGYVWKQAEIKNLGLIDPNINAGTGDYVGSLIGWMDAGTITDCYVEGGNVIGDEIVGGLVGAHGHRIPGFDPSVIPPYTISYCYSTSRVKGTIYIGGMVGFNIGRITNCYSMGSVFGNDIVGGLVGQDGDWGLDPTWGGKMLNCYSTSHVVGQSNTGGLVGFNVWGMIIYNCFWDIQTSGWTTSDGGTGKTTAEMQIASTFLEADWDFVDEAENGEDDVWWILDNQHYPRLWWQYGKAFSPHPQDGAVDVPQPLILSWLPGGSSLYHDVYFGEDKEAVANATIESPNLYRGRQEPEITTYDTDNLKLEKTYYWRIDEVNDADPNSPWKGDVWCFTTANFIVVDDFENYDADNQVWFSWHDGLGYGPPPDGYLGNGTGSAVGDETWTWGGHMETFIVHSGRQSMPYAFDNNKEGYAKYSEAEKTLSYPRDWMEEGVSELSLWFRGNPANNPEPMYVAIANSTGEPAIVYHDDLDAAGIDTWTEWVIPLQSFADQGIDLTDVDRIAIGFGTRGNITIPGGKGKMYFDDIRLYRLRPEQE